MSDTFTPMDEDKEYTKSEDPNKSAMNPSLISKILSGGKKRKVLPLRKPAKVLLPPCLVYISDSKRSILRIPSDYNFEKSFTKPKTIETRLCLCGNIAKYRVPMTLTPFCSLFCYKQLTKQN